MIHLNGHRLCAIDVETTGLEDDVHDIWDIAIIPLDSQMRPELDILPFNIEMRPQNLEAIDYGFVNRPNIERLLKSALEPTVAVDLFVEWVKRLDLPENKRIVPLAHNWIFDSGFIRRWMGRATYNLYIDGLFRDLMTSSIFVNDCADQHADRYPFPKHKLSYVCAQLSVEIDQTMLHSAYYDAAKTAEAYKKLCQLTQAIV